MSSTSNTGGIELRTRHRALAEAIELLSSMRFAITMLVMVAISAIIGTVMKQGEPMGNYVNQFGPFWFEVFNKIGLYALYSAWWFILILLCLVVSTSLCLIRNTPKMIKDMRSWREQVREESLRNFHHKTVWTAPLARAALAQQTAARLANAGFGVKLVDKPAGTLVAAKKGAASKFGYIFAHSAIIVILVGGALDSDLPIQFQQWFLGKTPFTGNGVIAQIPKQHRLGLSNPSFRGNTLIAEGAASDVAIIQRPDGFLLQDLPFTIYLKKFDIDFYSTGMPKLFVSEVLIKDHDSGATFPATIKVNAPLIYKGVAVYQSSFEDGGSKLRLTGFPMQGGEAGGFALAGEVGSSTPLTRGADAYTVEWSGFRPFNVENMGPQDARAVTKGASLREQFAAGLDKRLGSAAKNANNKDLKNFGPSVQYKLRDKTGQAREFQNYMQPVTLDGVEVYLAGVRATPADSFSYLRIPADDAHSVKEWMRLRAALQNPDLRKLAGERYAKRPGVATKDLHSQLQQQLELAGAATLKIFAGDLRQGGYAAIARNLEKLPASEQERLGAGIMKMLSGAMWELWQAAREHDGLAPVAEDDAHGRFLLHATNTLSDSFFYGAPVYLQLDDFTQVKASVFQVTRSPGKFVVYLGCLLLVLGVFSMFYIRERRVWVWLGDAPDGGSHALMAMSTQRKTLDFEREFNELKTTLPQSA
ncbi:MAG: cytochrome c biogenesis protein ResB [Pseudomonadota bacterium]